jgi:hypothetical protein
MVFFLFGALILQSPSAVGQSFLESIQAQRSIPFKRLQGAISAWGQNAGQYFSLGESHLENETAHPLALNLIKTYRHARNDAFHFCSETIDEFLNSDWGAEVKKMANKTQVVIGNSPEHTTFDACVWEPARRGMTYSGFFHQFPFARAWPLDFPATPVITVPGNNIRDQLAPRSGLFVSQLEMIYAQSTFTRQMIHSGIIDPLLFRRRVAAALKQIADIDERMELLVGSQNTPLTNKFGLVLAGDGLGLKEGDPNQHLFDRSYFILTKRGINRGPPSLGFLRGLFRMSNSDLRSFLSQLGSRRKWFVSGLFGPLPSGQRFRMQFMNLQMDGEAEVLQIGHHAMVMDFGRDRFQCYKVNEDFDVKPIEISCQNLFDTPDTFAPTSYSEPPPGSILRRASDLKALKVP